MASLSFGKALVNTVSEVNTISDNFSNFRNEVKDKYATKDSVKVLRKYTKGRFNKMETNFDSLNKGLDRSVEGIYKILDIVSDPTLPGYKQSWKGLKLHLITLRDINYAQKRIFEDKCTNNIFYKFFHYKEYKRYIIFCELYKQIQSILSRMDVLERENIIEKEEDCNE